MTDPDLHTMTEDEVVGCFFESLRAGDWDTAERMFRDLHERSSRNGIYADRDIARALDDGRIEVSPEIRDEQIQPTSLDLRMGKSVIDVADGRHIEPVGATHRFVPGRLYLAETLDHVTLSNDVAAEMTGRSSFGREGLVVHVTAGWVDAGWSGTLTMEMFNLGPRPVDIDVGERVAQLVFQETMSESSGYDGSYQGAEEPEVSKR